MSWLLQTVKTDCRHYVGEKPCIYKRTCPSCPHYSPMGKRILIIKLGAAGDALRTTPMLRELAAKHGRHHVTWVTDQISYALLKNNPRIDRLLLLDWDTALGLRNQTFDVLYSADKAPAAIALASQIQAKEKFGFTQNKQGSLTVFNDRGTYALFLGLSDPLKFRKNEKTYQEITFEMFDLPWKDQEYVFELSEEEKEAAKGRMESIGAVTRPLIGLNTGAGPVFATKKWPAERFVELARILKEKRDCTILILGGPDEVERNRGILGELGDLAINAGCDNPIRLFAGMVSELDVLVTADTLAMHLGIATGTKTVALFGPTTDREVTLYGRGVKLTGQVDCAPCYLAVCREEEELACIKQISVEQVAEAVEGLLL